MRTEWDAIVIGSGIGGLTAAALLARVAGKRVLVLEKHAEPGGFTHVFRRDGASWDVGLHYVGELAAGRLERRLFDFITNRALDWNRMPLEFERFIYPGFTFSVPSDAAEYERRLIARYPEEEKAIRRYFRDVRWASAWHVRFIQQQMMPPILAPFIALRQRFGLGKATQTTGAYLDRHVKSTELKSVLTAQWADYGLPPRESAFALHALVVSSYFHGGWFPKGGSGRVARTIEAVIEAHGGAIRTSQEVTRIVIENGRATGVRVRDGHCAEPEEIVHRAPLVISDAGAPITFLKLLPEDSVTGQATAGIRAYLARLMNGNSAVTLYVQLAKPLSTLGIMGENYWINASASHDDLAANTAALVAGQARYGYLSFPSAKSGETRFHTAEIVGIVDPTAFSAWKDSTSGRRSADYAALKQRISEGLLRLADLAVPGFSENVRYTELSTPLTIEHFSSHAMGRFYGLAGRPERYPPLSPRTPIPGLFLSGSDVAAPGIVGALTGGVGAVCQILGGRTFLRIMALSKQPPTPVPAACPDPASGKVKVTLLSKQALTPHIWRLDYAIEDAPNFAPGQYGKLNIAPFEWRAYSIAALENGRLTLLVSTRTGGDGSVYADKVMPGDSTLFELPLGTYRLVDNAHRKVFVATGTGLAPFLPMFRHLAEMGRLGEAELYFGCHTPDEDITQAFADILPKTVRCFSRSTAEAPNRAGRTTAALAELDFAPADTDFYICGAAAMVAACRTILEGSGASRILTEPY